MRRARISCLAGCGIKEPVAVLLHQRNGKRPAVRADFQRDVGIRIGDQLRLFRQVLDEHFVFLGGLDDIGRNQIMSDRPKNRVQGIGVMILGRRHQGVDGFLRRNESLFIRSRRAHRQRQRQESQASTGRQRANASQPEKTSRFHQRPCWYGNHLVERFNALNCDRHRHHHHRRRTAPAPAVKPAQNG